MKTKLLKKIRKRFTIEYYPEDKIYKVIGGYYGFKYCRNFFLHKEDAIEFILLQIRSMFYKYSRKHKLYEQQNKPIKVWWNG